MWVSAEDAARGGMEVRGWTRWKLSSGDGGRPPRGVAEVTMDGCGSAGVSRKGCMHFVGGSTGSERSLLRRGRQR